MLTNEENRLLTEVEGDAPMGRWMREKYWIPCARALSLPAGGGPKLIRLLGRNYVAFRATDGRVGFFDEACPHRGVSLMLARTEGCTLRCIFHGWSFDVSGKAVEVPSEGERSAAFAAKVKVNHYPTFEGGGLLWVWLGDGPPPPRPPVPFLDLPRDQVWVSRTITPCNWLQGVEGTLDSVHVGTLHHSWISRVRDIGWNSTIGLTLNSHPRYEADDTPYGLRAAALRKIGDDQQYLRVSEYVMPFITLVPNSMSNRNGTIFISVPIDNENHMLFWGYWDEEKPLNMDNEAMLRSGEVDYDNYASFTGTRENGWGQDREAMKRGHFSGFDQCLLQEDVVVQFSMGRIADRTKEQLCSSDVAIARARRRLLRELDAMANGEAVATIEPGTVARPIDALGPETVRWREMA